MGEVIREIVAPVEGRYIVRVYANDEDGRWRAWLEFTSLQHGDLSRTGVLQTTATRDDILRWASGLGAADLERALEDAELAPATALGTTPRPDGRPSPTR